MTTPGNRISDVEFLFGNDVPPEPEAPKVRRRGVAVIGGILLFFGFAGLGLSGVGILSHLFVAVNGPPDMPPMDDATPAEREAVKKLLELSMPDALLATTTIIGLLVAIPMLLSGIQLMSNTKVAAVKGRRALMLWSAYNVFWLVVQYVRFGPVLSKLQEQVDPTKLDPENVIDFQFMFFNRMLDASAVTCALILIVVAISFIYLGRREVIDSMM